MPQEIEHNNYHGKQFGYDLVCYQKKYGSKIVNYCLNAETGGWLLKENDEFDVKLLAIFKTKKLKTNDK